MTRETKVGLVIGLGVILLVGIIVSEYFVRDETLQDQPLAEGLADFNNTSNQSAQHPRGRVGDGLGTRGAGDPRGVMSATEAITEPGPGETPRPGPAPGMRPGPVRPGADVALAPGTFGSHNTRPGNNAATPGPAQPPTGPGEVAALPPVNPLPAPGPITRLDEQYDLPIVDNTQPPVPLADTPPRPATVQHVVAEGETLSHIARQYYNGDGNMWRSIRDANKDHVSPEGLVRAGTVLTIPKRSADAEVAAHGAAAETESIGQGLSDPERVRAQRGRLVTVQEGDTLSAIAAEHLGSANDWRLILDANPDVLRNENDIRPGMRLRIPAQAETEVADLANQALESAEATPAPAERRTEPPRPTTPATPAQPTQTYTVVAGDSLYRIAAKTLGNGNRFQEIFEANKDQLDDANDIREGMVLRIPASSGTRNP